MSLSRGAAAPRVTLVLAVPRSSNLRATVTVHAYAVTVVDESQRGAAGSAPNDSAIPPSVVVLPDVGDVVGGVYRLIRLLGSGMFGKVYVAKREDVPEHQVALKLLPRSHYVGRNVERELVMLATVGHPHVVQLKDHGMTTEYVWLTMPVYQGETLAERLERGPLGLREAHDIFVAIARGLDALHAAGLRHQDIKPENIFLAVFGGRVHPILLDLGVAAEKDATFIAGTALYASPEQLASLRGKPIVDLVISEKMDTYCLAATLLVSLVGEDRFPGASADTMDDLQRAQNVRADKPLPEGTLAEATGEARDKIQAALVRWLALDPAARPAMNELAEELDILLEPEREIARAEERARQRQRAALQGFRVTAGALLLLAGFGAWIAFSKRETLRLANELEKARAEGAKSFDKLDTCNASFEAAQGDVRKCKSSREKDKKICEEQLDAQMKLCTSGSQLDCALESKKIRDQSAARLKACEDDALEAVKVADAEQKRQRDEWEKQRTALVAERDEQKALAEKRAKDIEAITAERDKCTTERASCVEERDSLRSQMDPTGPKHPSGPTAPAGTSSAGTPTPTPTASAPPPPPPTATSPPPPPPPPPPPNPPTPQSTGVDDDDDPYK